MICPQCQFGNHIECPGETWCFCQHRGSESVSIAAFQAIVNKVSAPVLTEEGDEITETGETQ